MPTEFKLPELGENISAGDVMRVLVKPGDSVTNDQPVLELETDKATIEVPSSVAGTVGEVKVKPGEKVKVGQTIFSFEGADAKPTKAEAQPADAAAEGGQSQRANADRSRPAAGREEAVEEREGDK